MFGLASTRRKREKSSPIPSDTDTEKAFGAEVCCENCSNDHSRSLASQRWTLDPHCIIITRFHVSFAFRLLFTGFLLFFLVSPEVHLKMLLFDVFDLGFSIQREVGEGLDWNWLFFLLLPMLYSDGRRVWFHETLGGKHQTQMCGRARKQLTQNTER